MRRVGSFVAAATALLCATCTSDTPRPGSIGVPEPEPDTPEEAPRLIDVARLPLAFEQNLGQTDPRARYFARGPGYNVFLGAADAIVTLAGASDEDDIQGAAVRIEIVGANADPTVEPLDELPGTSNYFIGDDPAKWLSGVRQFARVRYRGIYDGIDLVFHGTSQSQIEYDFVVSPEVDPGSIALSFDGADEVVIDPRGNLVLETPVGALVQKAPVAYQDYEDGTRRIVSASYVHRSDGRVGFQVGSYDRLRSLVIDPVPGLLDIPRREPELL